VRRLPQVLAIAATFLATVAFSDSAWSCSCSARSVQELFEAADAVYEGKVVDVDMGYLRLAWCSIRYLFGFLPSEVEASCGVQMTIEVSHRWKGPESHLVRVATGRGGGDCGAVLGEGKECLLYLYELKPGMYGTNICMRPRLLNECAGDRDLLVSLSTRADVE